MTVYERIKEILEKRGIKQKYLAEKTNIKPNTLSTMLNGKSTIDSQLLIEFIIVLNISPNEFFEPIINEIKKEIND